MNDKELKINVPEGYEIDKENSTFECIRFKPIEKKKLPKTWEEFCKTHELTCNEFYINNNSELMNTMGTFRDHISDTNMLPNKETAEAMLALCQLIQLRDRYNGGWKPDWADDCQPKYTIYIYSNCINRILAFKTGELRNQFLENFRDLIETAKPLL